MEMTTNIRINKESSYIHLLLVFEASGDINNGYEDIDLCGMKPLDSLIDYSNEGKYDPW